jgi:hypothetical protein
MTDTQTHPIPLKTAVANAEKFIREIYGYNQIKDIFLEEVEFSESTNQWLITIGFAQKKNQESLILPERAEDRKYKTVHIDAQSGEPISMKIREI